MSVIATEEHVVTPDVVKAWRQLDPKCQDVSFRDPTEGETGAALLELGSRQVAAMDAAGINVAVLPP